MPQDPQPSSPVVQNCSSSSNTALNSSICGTGTTGQKPESTQTSKKTARAKTLDIEEELLQIEKSKLDIMKQNLEIQKKICECLQSLLTSVLFESMH